MRLRFRAAVARLEESRVLRSGALVTSGGVRRAAPGPLTDQLVSTYDLVAYGDREAEASDAAAAAEGWPEIVRERVGRG